MGPKRYFHLVFQPSPTLVSTVRKFTGEFYQQALADEELTARLALATHELLENAVAYSDDSETAIRIEIESDLLTIRTWNRTSPEHVAAVKSLIERIAMAPDSSSVYQQLMYETSRRSGGSGLGLARVRNECDMALSCEIEKDKLCIRAVAKVGARS